MTPSESALATFCQYWYSSDHSSIRYCLDRALEAYDKAKAHDT